MLFYATSFLQKEIVLFEIVCDILCCTLMKSLVFTTFSFQATSKIHMSHLFSILFYNLVIFNQYKEYKITAKKNKK